MIRMLRRIINATNSVSVGSALNTTNVGLRPESGANCRMRISLIHAMNGDILEIMKYDKNRDEWMASHYIIREGQTLPEAIALVMLMKE